MPEERRMPWVLETLLAFAHQRSNRNSWWHLGLPPAVSSQWPQSKQGTAAPHKRTVTPHDSVHSKLSHSPNPPSWHRPPPNSLNQQSLARSAARLLARSRVYRSTGGKKVPPPSPPSANDLKTWDKLTLDETKWAQRGQVDKFFWVPYDFCFDVGRSKRFQISCRILPIRPG